MEDGSPAMLPNYVAFRGVVLIGRFTDELSVLPQLDIIGSVDVFSTDHSEELIGGGTPRKSQNEGDDDYYLFHGVSSSGTA